MVFEVSAAMTSCTDLSLMSTNNDIFRLTLPVYHTTVHSGNHQNGSLTSSSVHSSLWLLQPSLWQPIVITLFSGTMVCVECVVSSVPTPLAVAQLHNRQ